MINYCSKHKVSYLKILCDSQAAILALNSKDINSKIVSNAIEALNAVAELTISTRLEWVKAHIGIEGNKEADKAAKEGADTTDISHTIDVPWTLKQFKIRSYYHKLWEKKMAKHRGSH